MEQFVLGIFQEQLSKFIVGFRKEQVNANLLNGKGEIVDVHLNCAFLNAQLKRITPFVELQSVHVSKLSFHVTSWTNIKKAPICVDVEDVTATVVEPMDFLDKSKRKTFQQLSKQDYLRLFAPKPRGPYNLFDRILDNLELEIRMVRLTFQPRGKFKTKAPGPWTPPKLCMTLRHLKYCSVDEFRNPEATPEDCWKHNQLSGIRPEHRILMIYKMATMKVTIEIEGQKPKTTTSASASDSYYDQALPPLMKDVSTNVHIAFQKRWLDAAFLGVQADITMEKMELHLEDAIIPDLAHAMAGMQYCLSKNRPFEDPLKAPEEHAEEGTDEDTGPIIEGNGVDDAAVENLGIDESKVQQILELSLEEDEISIVDEADAAAATDTTNKTATGTTTTTTMTNSGGSRLFMGRATSFRFNSDKNERPVLVFPSGLVIHEKVSVTLAIHDCQVRGVYGRKEDHNDDADSKPNEEGFLQIDCRGIVAEALWPKVTGEKGAYLQASISYVSVQEVFGTRIRTLVRGGIQPNYGKSRANKPAAPKLEVAIDEFFPLFEERCIRPDPLDLRHSFPAQAVGVKSTVSLVGKISNPAEKEFHVLHELGVDRFEITFDTESWCRAVRFALHESGGGFDPRWYSGDWSDELTPQMLVNPSEPLHLDDHLQKAKLIFFDENQMISSDLFNVTAKITNVSLRVPAAIRDNARSCDINVILGEMMLMVSSALPRTILTGKLGASIYGDSLNKEAPIVFPNDASDICYQMHDAEDPLVRQQGEAIARRVSTFRLQLTTRGFALNLVPVIPYCNAPKPQELLSPLEMTMIVCFEGEPPETPDSDLIKLGLFFTMQVHQVVVNLDFDVIMGAISTVLYHTRIIQSTLVDISKLPGLPQTIKQALGGSTGETYPTATDDASAAATDDHAPIASSIRGRRVLVRRQIERSRRTGGLGLDLNVQVGGFQLNLWRQNVPILTSFRASVLQTKHSTPRPRDHIPMKLVKLLGLNLEGIEWSVEWSGQQEKRRLILKACVTKLDVDVCDFGSECRRHEEMIAEQTLNAGQSAKVISLEGIEKEEEEIGESFLDPIMTRLVSLDASGDDENGCRGLALRAEEWKEKSRSYSLSALVDVDGGITLHVHEIENFLLLFMEGLLMPTDVRYSNDEVVPKSIFPHGSIASVLSFMIGATVSTQKQDSTANGNASEAPKDDNTGVVEDEPKSSEEIINMIDEIVLRKLPADVSRLLLHISVGKIAVFVPHQEGVDMPVDPECPWFRVALQRLLFQSRYFAPSDVTNNDQIMAVGSQGAPWSKIFATPESGFYHSLRLQQSLDAVAPNDSKLLTSTLVPLFEVGGKYFADRASIDMSDSVLSVQDFENVSHLYTSFRCFNARIATMAKRIRSVVAAMESKRESEKQRQTEQQDNLESNVRESAGSKLDTAVEDAEAMILSGRSKFEALKVLIEKQNVGMKKLLQKHNDAIERLYIQLFLREKARLAALALVSSQTAGWIRVGGMHVYGQRAPTTSTMWRYFAVLRKSLLILYDGPGKVRPLDVICLQGARLMSLAGGRRKRDIKFGFAVCEHSGSVRFFLAPNSSEFETWIQEVQRSIDTYSSANFARKESNSGRALRSGTIEKESSAKMVSSSDVGEESKVETQTSNKSQDSTDKVKDTIASASCEMETTALSPHDVNGEKKNSGNAGPEAEVESTTSIEPSIGLAERSTSAEYAVLTATEELGDAESNENVVAPQGEMEGVEMESSESNGVSHGEEELDEVEPSSTKALASLEGAQEGSSEISESKTATSQYFDETVEITPSEDIASISQNYGEMVEKRSSEHQNMFGQRFASMRSNAKSMRANAKNRFGNAMQMAREKAQAVAEEQRQRRERNRIQSDSMHSVESASTAVASNTFSTRNRTFSSNSIDTESVGSVDTESESGRGQQLRHRVSKISASFRQVGQSSSNEEETAKPYFKFRPTFGSQQATTEESDFVKLKSILVDPRHPASGNQHALPSTEKLDIARLQGTWTTKIRSVLPSDNNTSAAATVGNLGQDHEKGSDAQQTVAEDLGNGSSSASSFPAHVLGSSTSKEFNSGKRRFQIEVSSPDLSAAKKVSQNYTTKTFIDVVQFHFGITESISKLSDKDLSLASEEKSRDGGMGAVGLHDSVESDLGIAPLDIVKLTLHLFEGLLDTSSKIQSIVQFHEYQCEVLQELLNSLLTCPLPGHARNLLLSFLSIRENPNWEFAGSDDLALLESHENDWVDYAGDIAALSAACQTELLRAESAFSLAHGLRGNGTAQVSAPRIPVTPRNVLSRVQPLNSPAPYLDSLLPSGVSEGLRDAMYEALMTVMAERDEAQAQLIAASVLHVHQMESERKKMDLLQEKLRLSQEETKLNQKQSIFGDRFKRQPSKSSLFASQQDLQKYQEQVIENTDSELVGLCQQLAGEISAKTSANLEVLRMKESRKIEREQDAAEKQALQEELRKARAELAAEREKARLAMEEVQKLR